MLTLVVIPVLYYCGATGVAGFGRHGALNRNQGGGVNRTMIAGLKAHVDRMRRVMALHEAMMRAMMNR
ncbi:MAG: hypothetical protein ACREMM_01280 [Gemmatimonadales bacterium]